MDISVSKEICFRDWKQGGEQLVQQLNIKNNGKEPCPIVIAGPLTNRFTLEGPLELASPMMPLLQTGIIVSYRLQFICPKTGETDYLWDNFRDLLVIHLKQGRIDIDLRAIKIGNHATDESFTPARLPKVQPPSKSLFDFVQNTLSSSSVYKSSSSLYDNLAPPPPTTTCLFTTTTIEIPQFPLNKVVPLETTLEEQQFEMEKTLEPFILDPSFQIHCKADAKEVIFQLRAKLSGLSSIAKLKKETEAKDDELKEFNNLIVQSKEKVKRGNNELTFYQDIIETKMEERSADLLLENKKTPIQPNWRASSKNKKEDNNNKIKEVKTLVSVNSSCIGKDKIGKVIADDIQETSKEIDLPPFDIDQIHSSKIQESSEENGQEKPNLTTKKLSFVPQKKTTTSKVHSNKSNSHFITKENMEKSMDCYNDDDNGLSLSDDEKNLFE